MLGYARYAAWLAGRRARAMFPFLWIRVRMPSKPGRHGGDKTIQI